MTALINPQIQVRILGSTEITLPDVHKEFEIVKDLDDEPNTADVTIYNLSQTTRDALTVAAGEYAPIEIAVSSFASPELVRAFAGEIDSITHRATRPGHETRIHCTSQLRTHRAAYIDGVTYAAGTPISTIVDELVAAIGLPLTGSAIPSTGILSSQTYTGPAFPLLCRVAADIGRYCYLLDGELHISGIEEPSNPTTAEILPEMMVSTPQAATRTDARDTELRVLATERQASNQYDRFLVKKRKKRKKKELKATTYEEIDVVDVVVPGVEVETFCIPNLQPDHLISIEGTIYRVWSVTHYGDDYGGTSPTTRIQADQYDGESTEVVL